MNALKKLIPITLLVLTGCLEEGTNIDVQPAILAALPGTEVANAAPDGPMSDMEAFRLLDQGTFGAQLEDIKAVAAMGPNAWIDQQMAMPGTYLRPTLLGSRADRWNEYVNAWWRNTIQSEDQLRQRVAFALSEIFVVSGTTGLGDEQEGLANYYDILVRNAFGNYRDLLEDITLNPIMGEYLSMKGNRKPDPAQNIRPDENYAREVLQLFSIGLSLLNNDGTEQLDAGGVPIPAYDQSHVEALAHVFTGWHFANAEEFRWPQNKDYLNPMKAWPEYHDTGVKVLPMGRTLPAGRTAEQDLEDALDAIFYHPNVGPFIVKQMIQRLVTSNPSPGYVNDVADVFNSNYNGERGNLASVVKAILMHSEARQGHLDNPTTFGKVKEPLLKLTQLYRAFEPDYISYEFNYSWAGGALGQAPLQSPTVFNFFRPEFAQPGVVSDNNMVSPELQIVDETSIISITSQMFSAAVWSHNYTSTNDRYIILNYEREMALEPNPNDLVDHLDLVLLGGRMSTGLRNEVLGLMASRLGDSISAASTRVADAIYLILSSPEAAVQL